MSIRLMSEVWTRDLPHPAQSVLLALADHADDEGGSVFPSMALVAWKTGYSKRQVQRIIRELEDQGALILVAEAVRYRANEYRIDLEAVPMKAPFRGDNLTPLAESGVTPDVIPGVTQPGHPRGDIALSSRTITEPPEEPSSNGGTSPSALKDEDQNPLDALGSPTDPLSEEELAELAGRDKPEPAPSDDQVYLAGRLWDHAEGWKALNYAAVVRLNKDFGRQTVTEAMRRMWEEAQSGADTPKAPFALIRQVCRDLKVPA